MWFSLLSHSLPTSLPTQINKALKTYCFQGFSAGDERIELPPKVLETPIIPFDQSPIFCIFLYIQKKFNTFRSVKFSRYIILYLQNFTQKVSNLTPLFSHRLSPGKLYSLLCMLSIICTLQIIIHTCISPKPIL